MNEKITWRDVAWFFEGEGSVGYYRVNPGSGANRLYVRISSSNRKILEEINASLGSIGSVLRSVRPGSFSGGVLHKKGSFNLTWTCRKAFYILEQMVAHMPPCSEKRSQIEFCLHTGVIAGRQEAEILKAKKRAPAKKPRAKKAEASEK